MSLTDNKGLEQPAYGTTNWDTLLNANFGIIDEALGGSVTLALASVTTYTFTEAELQPLMLIIGGAGANCVATIPNNAAGNPIAGQWLVRNTSSNILNIENVETPGTYAKIAPLGTAWVVSDGVTAYIVQPPALVHYDDGVLSSGSFRPKYTDGMFQTLNNNGAFTLLAPALSGQSYEMFVLVTNGASAGAITFSGFTATPGAEMDTTSGHKFLIRITRVNASIVAETISLQAATTSYNSGQQTISNAATLTLNHGLGVVPSIIQWKIVCISTEAGYAVNDEVMLSDFGTSSNTSDNKTNVALVSDTQIKIIFCDNSGGKSFSIPNKTTYALTPLTNSKWKLVISAFVL